MNVVDKRKFIMTPINEQIPKLYKCTTWGLSGCFLLNSFDYHLPGPGFLLLVIHAQSLGLLGTFLLICT